MNRKSNIGVGIIVMALLLLLGGMMLSDGNNTNYDGKKGSQVSNSSEDYLFFLNETSIGRQKKVTESFPNFEVGSREEFRSVFVGNSFRLVSNPFTTNEVEFIINNPFYNDSNYYLLYFSTKRISGDEVIIIKVNGREISRMSGSSKEIPVTIPKVNQESFNLSVEFRNVPFYELFNWNKADFTDMKVIAVEQDKDNNVKKFGFDVDTSFLEKAYLSMVVSCYEQTDEIGKPIKVKVNGYILSDTNPHCSLKNNRIEINVPTNILFENRNEVEIETTGFYKIAYSINKVYFNDKDVYKFSITNFEDFVDVIIYGDYDVDVLDLKINDKIISLERDKIRSIWGYLRFGVNEVEILTKPVDIEELKIEATTSWDYD